jgi:hypothetical protein
VITQVIHWIPLAVVGRAAFAALGIRAQETDEHHRAQRRAVEMQALPMPAQRAAEADVMTTRTVTSASRAGREYYGLS